MPSQTFLNLPIEKQRKLLNAARKEFSKALLPDASINQIIKEANISRGSFYMYFDSKEDIYFYLLEDTRKNFFNQAKIIFKEVNGDLIEGFSKFFNSLMAHCLNAENKDYLKNVLLNITFKNEYPIFIHSGPTKMKKDIYEFAKLINKDSLNINTDEDIYDILNIIMMLTIHNLAAIVKNPALLEQKKKRYYNQLKMLENGFYKK